MQGPNSYCIAGQRYRHRLFGTALAAAALLGALSASANVHAAITRIQSVTASNGSGAPSATWPVTTTAGNLLVAVITYRGGTGSTITPPVVTPAWTLAIRSDSGTTIGTAIYYIANSAAQSSSAWAASGGANSVVTVTEFQGAEISGALDVTATNTNTSTTPSTGTTAATSQAKELAIAAYGTSSTSTFSAYASSYSELGQITEGSGPSATTAATAYGTLTSVATQSNSATLSSSKLWVAAIATFKASTGTRYWIGSGSGNWDDNTRWSKSSGGSNDAPWPRDPADVIVFDSGGTGDIAIRTNPNVSGIQITSGYSGTISLQQSGLVGDFYRGSQMETYMSTYLDTTVNYVPTWDQTTGTARTGGADQFSCRWTGQVKADYTETYTFYAYADDSTRLWVNGTLLIDKWTASTDAEYSATIALTAGQWYSIQFDHREAGSNARAVLSFSSASQSKVVIPSSNLRTYGVLTLGSGGFSQAGGTFTAGQGRVQVGGAFSLSGGTFTAPASALEVTGAFAITGGTFTANAGSVVLRSSGATTIGGTFNNLRIEPTVATNLVGYWKLDEGSGTTTKDHSSGANNGTLTNGTSWVTSSLSSTISFDNNAAASFDGTNDYIDMGAPATATNASYSACAWVNLTAASGTRAVVSISGTNISGFFLKFENTVFKMQMRSVDNTSSALYWVDGTTTPTAGTWYHVCGTFDTTDSKIRLYVNGVSEGTPATVSATWNATGHTLIGADIWGGALQSYAYGKLDDVRIYNVALTAAQVAALAAGKYPAGLAGAPTYTLSADTTASGTFALDAGTLATSSYILNASSASSVATVNSGTLSIGSAANTFSGGLTVNKYGALTLPTSGGSVKIGSTKTLTIDGTLNASSTGATIQSVSGNYTFSVGSSATATPTLNINGLAVRNTDTNGMYINSVAGSSTTVTQFDNISFATGTGDYLLRVYSTSLALYANGLSFDASTSNNMKLAGNGTGDGETRAYLGATCTATPCEWFDADDDSEPDGVGDASPSGDEAVVQWMHRAYSDTAGTIEGFPTTAFDWNLFTYWNTYVAYRDYSGGTDRLFARDGNGAFLTQAGGAGYYWDLPGSVGDIVGTPRWTMEDTTHYVYVITTLGYVYKLSDSGTAFAIVSGWPYQNGGSATGTSPLAMDGSNVYWAGNDSAGAKKMFSLTFAKSLNGTRTVVADVVATPGLASVSGTTYLFTGTNGSIYRTPTDLSSELTGTQTTSTVYGRLTVLNGNVYFPEGIGKIWALSATDLTTIWSYQDLGTHSGSCPADGQCTVRSLYVDPSNQRTYFGDEDGHLYVVSNSGTAITNYPFRPGASTDKFRTAPFFNEGVIVIGSTTGKVFVIDQSAAPAVYQTFDFQQAISTISYDKDGQYVIGTGTAPGKLYYLNGVTDPTPGSP